MYRVSRKEYVNRKRKYIFRVLKDTGIFVNKINPIVRTLILSELTDVLEAGCYDVYDKMISQWNQSVKKFEELE